MSLDEYYAARDFVHGFEIALAGQIPHPESLVYGAVIGTVNQVGCVKHLDSPWFEGKFGHVYENARELIVPELAIGHLGLWDWEVPEKGLCYAGQTDGCDKSMVSAL
jgi:hypothetical protein